MDIGSRFCMLVACLGAIALTVIDTLTGVDDLLGWKVLCVLAWAAGTLGWLIEESWD